MHHFIFEHRWLFLSGKVLNDDSFEIRCTQIWGIEYKYDSI